VRPGPASWIRGLQAELNEALTGIESPDDETAGRLHLVIHGLAAEIGRLEKLRKVRPAAQDFQAFLSRLLTDDMVTTLELWTGIRDYWSDVTVRLVEIRKEKTGRRISCTLRLEEPTRLHLYTEYTTAELEHIGWKAGRGGKIFYYKTKLKTPDAFEAFCHLMSVTMLEAMASLWGRGQQYYRFK
jgi:hypothetical protein